MIGAVFLWEVPVYSLEPGFKLMGLLFVNLDIIDHSISTP